MCVTSYHIIYVSFYSFSFSKNEVRIAEYTEESCKSRSAGKKKRKDGLVPRKKQKNKTETVFHTTMNWPETTRRVRPCWFISF